jgi:hypothetical protein
MENMDLNIQNYNLDDILELFRLTNKKLDFNDMKQAKNIALMTHPDKSSLDPKVFLFFKQAFGLLKQVYDFQNKSEGSSDKKYKQVYEEQLNDCKEEKKLVNHFTKTESFNKKFNKIFEENRMHNECIDTGYADWLKSNEDLEEKKINNISEMNNVIEEKKKNLKNALIVKEEVDFIENRNNYADLSNKKPEEYSSDVFSKLQYEDVYKAHTETVIPVNMEDYNKKEKFNSVNDLNQHRNSQNMSALSLEQSNEYLRRRTNMEHKSTNERAYELAKESEAAEKANKSMWGYLKQIGN